MHPFEYTAKHNSPLERRYGATSYGQSSSLTSFLGAVGSQSVIDLLDDPAMQAKLVEVQVQCKERAKEGVSEWMKENWGYLVAGGALIVGLNYFMLVAGVLPVARGWRR